MESRKMVLQNLFTAMEKQTQRIDLWIWGRGEKSEMYGKSNMETYITICITDQQWEFAIWLRKLKQGICINLEEWDGEGDGREVQKGGDIYNLWLIHAEI